MAYIGSFGFLVREEDGNVEIEKLGEYDGMKLVVGGERCVWREWVEEQVREKYDVRRGLASRYEWSREVENVKVAYEDVYESVGEAEVDHIVRRNGSDSDEDGFVFRSVYVKAQEIDIDLERWFVVVDELDESRVDS
jgi:hypothetical protein